MERAKQQDGWTVGRKVSQQNSSACLCWLPWLPAMHKSVPQKVFFGEIYDYTMTHILFNKIVVLFLLGLGYGMVAQLQNVLCCLSYSTPCGLTEKRFSTNPFLNSSIFYNLFLSSLLVLCSTFLQSLLKNMWHMWWLLLLILLAKIK